MGIKFETKKSNNKYQIGNDKQTATGSVLINIPPEKNCVITERIDIVNTDVPFLIVLDVLGKHNMYVNNVSKRLVCEELDMKVPIFRRRGHLFVE